MSPERAPFAALDDILRRTRHLLIDFDGPICSLFAGTLTAPISDRLRKLLTRQDVHLPAAIENTDDWFKILTFAASVSSDLAASVEAELAELELAAAATAVPTPYALEAIVACRDSARSVAVISNNSASAVRAYVEAHDLASQIRVMAARTEPDPLLLNPSPHLVEQAARELGASPFLCAVVGDSPGDVQAARAAGAPSIGYAATAEDADHLAAAGAGAVISSMADLALRLRARVADVDL